MRWRSLGLLAATLVVLAGAYYVLETRGKKSGDDAKRVFVADEKEVEQISIRRKEESILVKRDGGEWRLVEPVLAKTNGTEISSLLNTILNARQERGIDDQPKNLAEYGLEQPAILLTVTLQGGKRLPELLLGDKNPNGFSAYAKRGDQPAVFLVADSLRSRLDRKADDLRDKTLLPLDPDKVKQVKLTRKGQTITLTSGDAQSWEMTQPTRTKADGSMVRDLLWKIKDARAKGFLAGPRDSKRRYGLDRPDLVVELTEADASKRLLLKAPRDPKAGLYALAEPGEGVVSTDARLLTDLSKSPDDLRDRSLLRFETTDVTSLTIRRGGQVLNLAKEGDVWKLKSPAAGDAQAGKIYDLLYALKELRYHALVAQTRREDARYGLKSPQAEVELGLADGSRLPTLLIGTSANDRLYAKLAASPEIYTIDPKLLDRIPTGLEALQQESGSKPGK